MFWKMQCALALLAVLVVTYSDAQRSERRKAVHSVPVSADVKKAIDFDCPEEFGYYPHPSDCTQYYVCVFGGALLESCTGGLMYSHELQTCDWPRNVGCTAGGEVADTPRIQQQPQQQQQQQHVVQQVSRSSPVQRPTAPAPQPQSQRIRVQAQPPPPPPRPSPNPVVTSRGQPTHINHQEIVKQLNNFQQQLYADVDEQLPPAEEIENDTQQRVLRGQPSSLGAVQRDRDGLSQNTIRQGKVGAFSFGTQIDRDEILQNYSEILDNLTDVIEPSNTIDDNVIDENAKGEVENIRKKRETAEDRAFTVESDDRDKRQIRYGRVQQGNNHANQNNVNHRWNEQKKKQSEYVQFPSSQFNAGSPFKPSAQIGEGFSPLTGSGINLQNKPTNSQFKTHQTNDDTFKPIISDSSKQYSSNVPKFSSSTPNYAYFTLNSQDSKSAFPHSTTATPIHKENFQYFSLKPEPSITKSPPISSLKSPSQSPFAALSGGFYNNKPETSINYNTKVKSPHHNSFVSKQPILGSTPTYNYEIGSKRPTHNTFFPVSTSSPLNDYKPKNQIKPSRLPPVRTSSSNRIKQHPQNGRPSANYEATSNKNRIHLTRQPKVKPDQYHGHSSTSPKYVNNNNNNNDNNNNADEEDEEEEDGEDEEGEEEEDEPEKGEKSKTEETNNPDDADSIRPEFPEPPIHYIESVNKYEDIVNPFADPNFDFDSFISKVRNNHLSNVGPKVIENLNSQVKPNHHISDHTPKVKNEFLNDHHRYTGMSTPRPFSSSSVSWPANTNSQRITPKPTSSTSANDYDEDDEYYDDDDYKFSVTEKNKIVPSRIQYPTKNTLSNNHKTQYNNNFSNSLSKPPLNQYQSYPQSGTLYRDEIRRPYANNTFNQRIPTYQTHTHSSGGSNKIKNTNNNNNNKYITSTSSKPIYHSSFKISPTSDYESGNKYVLQDSRPTHGNAQTNYNNNKRPNEYKTSSKYSDNNGYRQQTSTPAPKKRRPIPKPSPEMNDYYYDEDEDDYYYEPPVKSKFMPSTEVKPQRPPIAQNYEEYDDYRGSDNRKPNSGKRPINNNETYDTDDSGEENEAQLKRPVKAKPTYQSVTNNAYSKHPNNINIQPTKTSILIPVKFDMNNFHPIDNKRPAPQSPVQTNHNVIKRPEIANYEVLHSTSNVPVPTKLPSSVHKPRYLNQTTLRPYTVRHRLAKPSSTLSTYSDTYIPNPTKQTALRHPTKVTQIGNYKQPLLVSSTLKTDNENQETRHTDHDDNAPNRVEPVVSSSPTYTRQKGTGGRALYNTTSLQYDQQPYDPYYALYDEDQELYKDSDYAQQYNSASQRPAAQQPFRSTASPASASPTPSTQHYTPSQASVYTPQHVSAEDYDDALINPDIDDHNQYQQPVRSSTTSTLDLINELGFGLSTLGGILRTSISPRVVTTPSTTTSTTTYTPPTRAPVVQRSTTSDTVMGNLEPPTERYETLATKQPVVYNNRYTADSLKSQRLLLQTRRKQLRLLQNNKTPNSSHESQASENVSQFVRHGSQPTQSTELTQQNSEPLPNDSEPISNDSELTPRELESTQLDSEPIQNEPESTDLEPTQDISETKHTPSTYVSEPPQHDSEPSQNNLRPTLRRSKSKYVLTTEISTQHLISTASTLERASESTVAPEIVPTVSEIKNDNPITASDIPVNPPVNTNTSRFLSVSTGFSFRKDNDDSSNEEPSYTLRVYKTPARNSVPESPAPEQNEVSENNAPKVSYQIDDLVVENVDQPSKTVRDDVRVVENVIVSSERPRPITFLVENLPKPGQKPIVIQLKSHTGPRSHGPRIGPQESIIPIYNRPSNRVFNAPTQDTFIYFKPSPQTQKEVYNVNNHTIIADANANHNKQKVVLKTVIKRPTTTATTSESPVNYNEEQANASDNDESDSSVSYAKEASKSNLSKEDIEFVPKDIVSPGTNRRTNAVGTFPNTLLRRKAFRDVFNAKTESSLSNQPNVSPFKTLENLLKDERFDRTTPTNRFQNNIIATTPDPIRRLSGRRGTPTPPPASVDQQFEDSFVSSVGGKSKETTSSRRTIVSPAKKSRNQENALLNNPLTQNIIQNIYKFSSGIIATTDKDGTSVLIGEFGDSDESIESEEEIEDKKTDAHPKYAQNPIEDSRNIQSENKYSVTTEKSTNKYVESSIEYADKSAERPTAYENTKEKSANKYAESSVEYDSAEKYARRPTGYDNNKDKSANKYVESFAEYNSAEKYARRPTGYDNNKDKSTNKYVDTSAEYATEDKYARRPTKYDNRNEQSPNKYAETSIENDKRAQRPTEYNSNKYKSANKYVEISAEYDSADKYARRPTQYDNRTEKSPNKYAETSVEYDSADKYAPRPTQYDNSKDTSAEYPIEYYDNQKDKSVNKYAESSAEYFEKENDNKYVKGPVQYTEAPIEYNNERGKSANKYAGNPNQFEKPVNKYADHPIEYNNQKDKSAEYPIEFDNQKDKNAEVPIEFNREQGKPVNKHAESSSAEYYEKENDNKYAKGPVEFNSGRNIKYPTKYEKTQPDYGKVNYEEPIIIVENDKNAKTRESHVESPVLLDLTEYDVDGGDYEEYDDNIPDALGPSSTTTISPRTYPTTTSRPTPPPTRETPPPITTPETLWTRVTQRNRITPTESPYRSRGAYFDVDKYNGDSYDERTKTFNNDVYKTVDDFNNNVYDGSRRTTTEKERTYSTAPSHASTTTTTPIPLPAKTVYTTPIPVKSTSIPVRASSFRPASVRTSQTTTHPPPSTTPSGRTLRINNDIKSKALAGQRSYSPNKCTENSLQSKCNNDNNLQRTNTRGRGSAHYTTANGGEQSVNTNRGTPPTSNRVRPTLKPSTSIVSKAQEFVDIYRYPPRRPDNVYPTPQVDKTAAKCRKDVCLLPDCSCGGKDIPGNLPVEEVPQIVLITFDDAVNDLNKATYSEIFEQGRKNPNGCPIAGTFYVSHEWTDYSQVQNLYADGHEMASHTVSHSFGEQFSQKKWNREVGGQREILSAYGGVKLEDVRGMRAPFLSVGGNKMFKMLYDSNFTYDSSMPVYENRPPSWPYTLDYKLFHDCMIPPCPTKSYPGVWEVPMVMWQDLNGGRCSMGDACSNPPNAEGVYKMLLKNFDRHYTTNRAPFGLFYHAAWFTQPHHKEGFIMFLDTINAMKDVFLVTNWQALQWVRDPTPLSRINSFQPFHCNYQDRPKRCNNPKVCNLWHKSGVRYMRTCQPCPDIYPWTGKTGIRSSRIDNEIEE